MCLLIGDIEKLFFDDSRLIFDDRFELSGFFIVVWVDDKKIIKVNSVGLVGKGVFIVCVYNVYNVCVIVNVVGYFLL